MNVFIVYAIFCFRYTYGKPVIGKVLLRGDLDYYYSPWKYHGDEVMVELHLDVSQLTFA